MRDIFVEAKLQVFRVDHYQLELIRTRLVKQRENQGIEKYAHAGSGRSGDEPWGICARSDMPLVASDRSFPSVSVSSDGELTNSELIQSGRAKQSSGGARWGLRCQPWICLGYVRFRIDSALSARHKSSARPVMRLYFNACLQA